MLVRKSFVCQNKKKLLNIWRSFWGHFWVILGSFWGHFGVIVLKRLNLLKDYFLLQASFLGLVSHPRPPDFESHLMTPSLPFLVSQNSISHHRNVQRGPPTSERSLRNWDSFDWMSENLAFALCFSIIDDVPFVTVESALFLFTFFVTRIVQVSVTDKIS